MRIVLAALLATALSGCGVPPDSEMIAWFQKNRAEFIALRDMARQEKSIARIGDGFVWLENNLSPSAAEVQAALPPERMAVYKRLFERLRLPTGISIYRPELSVCMYAFAQGLAVSGAGKGYCWLPKPPERLVTTPLEAWPDAGYVSGDNFEGYREIEPGWYLKQDSS